MKLFNRFKSRSSRKKEEESSVPEKDLAGDESLIQPADRAETNIDVEPEADPIEKQAEPIPEDIAAIDTVTENDSAVTATVANTSTETKKGFFSRLKNGLKRTSSNFSNGLGRVFLGKKEIDEELLEELETQLLVADVGIEATQAIMDSLAQQLSRKALKDPEALFQALKDELKALLHNSAEPWQIDSRKRPYVILIVGVNGVGKTTTIGKLTKRFQAEGKSVMLAAGDTFRAAAVEQLQVWGERNNVPVVAQHTGADSASVIFDAVKAAQARDIDVLIADTAGRLHNKDNLMEELRKVVRVMGKLDDSAPHEVMLVLDAGTGQNALSQAKTFQEVVGVSGITLTKLDGTAKGGIIFAISKQLQLPIRFIGVGEQVDDLRPFNPDDFVAALFSDDEQSVEA